MKLRIVVCKMTTWRQMECEARAVKDGYLALLRYFCPYQYAGDNFGE